MFCDKSRLFGAGARLSQNSIAVFFFRFDFAEAFVELCRMDFVLFFFRCKLALFRGP